MYHSGKLSRKNPASNSHVRPGMQDTVPRRRRPGAAGDPYPFSHSRRTAAFPVGLSPFLNKGGYGLPGFPPPPDIGLRRAGYRYPVQKGSGVRPVWESNPAALAPSALRVCSPREAPASSTGHPHLPSTHAPPPPPPAAYRTPDPPAPTSPTHPHTGCTYRTPPQSVPYRESPHR